MHSLLKRQIRKHFGGVESIPGDWKGFIDLVENAYHQFDVDRTMLERSLDLSSQELLQANSDIRAVFERIIAGSVDGIFAIDSDFHVIVWNPGMELISGIKRTLAAGRNVFDLFAPFRQTGDDRFLHEALQGKTTIAKESTYVVNKTGEKGIFESHFSPLKSESGEIIGGFGIIRDVTERRKAERELEERSIRDLLTNLYNRRYFDHRMIEEMSRADRNGSPLAILLCDLDQFKSINDDRGHQWGDEALKTIANSILDSIRGSDLVFRWGGDEFVVVIPSKTRQGVITTSERIRSGIKKVGSQLGSDISVSIGISMYPDHGRDLDGLIRLAERALYIAKKRGDKIHVGEEEFHLNQDSVQVVFQPIVDITANRTIGFEALSRYPQGKLNVEDLFKKYESVGQLDRLKEICCRKQVAEAGRIGLERAFINVDFRLLERIDSCEHPAGLDVILEISEKEALHEIPKFLAVSQKWREKGFKFAIDDFGAGFMSLPLMAQLIPDYIKIDRSTILQAVHSTKFRRFLRYLVLALRSYTKEGVIAEGIENQAELEVVKNMKIDLVQGYLFGKPHVMNGPDD